MLEASPLESGDMKLKGTASPDWSANPSAGADLNKYSSRHRSESESIFRWILNSAFLAKSASHSAEGAFVRAGQS